VLQRLRVALHAFDMAHASIDARREMPLVRLGIIPLVGIHALGHVVGAMHADRSLPRLQIELGTVEGLLRDLSEGRVDAVVGFLDDASVLRDIPQLTVRSLWDERLVIVAANDHPLAARKKVSLAMARDEDWVLMPPASSTRRALERIFLHAGLTPPEPCVETASFHIGLSLVADSQLLAAVPESASQQRSSAVRILPMEVIFPATTMVFATLAEVPLLPAVELIARRFQDHAQSL
jgi:DNA-binding transcriptional LysR family regulator